MPTGNSGTEFSPEDYVRPGKASGRPGFTPPVCVNSAGNRARAVRERRTLERAAASIAASAGYANHINLNAANINESRLSNTIKKWAQKKGEFPVREGVLLRKCDVRHSRLALA
jgi:hypothetical protein